MINETLHTIEYLEKGDIFLEDGKPCTKIGMINKGILRGFVTDNNGNEITTHFYQERDIILGTYLPQINMTMTIEAIDSCEISVASYSKVMLSVNKDLEITEIITREFQKFNNLLQTRLVSLLNLNSVAKYELFLKEYPELINKIPHYYIAQYLGITPTQLSRARKQFAEKRLNKG